MSIITSLTTEQIVSLVIAIMTFIGVMYTSYTGRATKRETVQINDAVNHRGPDGLRLYEIALAGQAQMTKLDGRLDDVEKKVDTIMAHPFLQTRDSGPLPPGVHIRLLDNS